MSSSFSISLCLSFLLLFGLYLILDVISCLFQSLCSVAATCSIQVFGRLCPLVPEVRTRDNRPFLGRYFQPINGDRERAYAEHRQRDGGRGWEGGGCRERGQNSRIIKLYNSFLEHLYEQRIDPLTK